MVAKKRRTYIVTMVDHSKYGDSLEVQKAHALAAYKKLAVGIAEIKKKYSGVSLCPPREGMILPVFVIEVPVAYVSDVRRLPDVKSVTKVTVAPRYIA